jgi:cyanophycin synthetase
MARSLCGGVLRAVVTVPGDRRDCGLFDIGRICGAGFDELVVYEAEPRGRAAGETARHILAGAASAGQDVPRWLHAELDVRCALALALARCNAGDMLVFTCGSSLDELVAVVRGIDPAGAERIDRARA